MTLYSGHLVTLRRGTLTTHAVVGYSIVTDTEPIYGAPLSVECTIDNTDDYGLYYTIDGSAPSLASEKYTAPFLIFVSGVVSIRAIEKETGWLTAVKTAQFLISIPVSFDAEPCVYYDPFDLIISASDPAYDIYYSVDGSAPETGLKYNGPFLVTGTWSVLAVPMYAGIVCGPVAGPMLFERYAQLLVRLRILFDGDGLAALDAWTRSEWAALTASDIRCLFLWAQTSGADGLFGVGWSGVTKIDSEVFAAFSKTLTSDVSNSTPWNLVDQADQGIDIPWGKTEIADSATSVPWGKVGVLDSGSRMVWGLMDALDMAIRLEWGRLMPVDLTPRIPWTKMKALDLKSFSGFDKGEETQKEHLVSALFRLPWISAARFIMTKQNIVFKRVADDMPVRILTGSIGIDENSWDYEFSGVVPSREDLLKIIPDALGAGTGPVLVELSINGYPSRFLVDAYSENRQWAKGTYNISGRSPSCVLGPGYGQLETRIYTGTNAEQIVASTLSETGFTYQWGLVENTWNINGEFSVCDKTKIEIISEIARAVGGIVQTNPMGQVIELKKRHPVSPKNYWNVTPDETILSGVITQGGAYQTRQKYNSVVVSGKETGVFLTVVRENTEGDRQAPEIIDPLLTAQALNVERGRAYLDANGYDCRVISLELPLPEAGSGQRPKMLFPCEMVEVFDGIETWRGRVVSAEVGFEPAKTRQRISVERYYV